MNARISRSRSTISRTATDCTRPGRQTPRDLRPQQRRQFEADDAIEETPRLLRADATRVDRRRIRERFLDRFARDFVENDAPIPIRIAADRFLQMPGNRLAFAVEVGREIDLVGFLGELAQFVDDLLLARAGFRRSPSSRVPDRRPSAARVESRARFLR